MKIGFSSGNLIHRDLLGNIAFSGEHGFSFIEMNAADVFARQVRDPDYAKRLEEQLNRHGVTLTVHSALPDPRDPKKTEAFQDTVRYLYDWILQYPGICELLSFDTWVNREKSLPFLLWVLDLFKDTDQLLATEDYPLNPKDADHWKTAMDYPNYRLLMDLGHTNVRLTDTGDQQIWCLRNEGENWPLAPGDNSPEAFGHAIAKKPLPIAEVHLHNNNGLADQHAFLSNGTADFRSIANVLKRSGFDGLVDLEVIPHLHQQFDADADACILREKALWEEYWAD